MASVRFENVTKMYGQKTAIENLNLECKKGEFFSIVGPAGAGKSTILKMIAGIEPVTSGKIYLNDTVVNDLSPRERDVAMAFESYNLYSFFSVYENIAFPLKAPVRKNKLSSQEERKRVTEVADFLGIKRLLDRKPVQLSGGEKQRVSLARAMVRRCECFLLDEPIAHLDARLKFSTQTALKKLSVKLGTAIVYVTHDYREALGLSDKMGVLRKGRIEQIGTPREIYNSPATDFVANFIGDPPCNLIDGELVNREDKTFFRAGNEFSFRLEAKTMASAEKKIRKGASGGVRMGIRAAHVKVSRDKRSETSIQLPIYAVVRRPQGVQLTFELEKSFFRASVTGASQYDMSEKVWLDFDQDRTFFFKKTIEISK
ncbi:MAG: ABC transporter ATP-binding protein [Deltaproteobacteria bacterium]|jgi:multiple sugar transport system ATP-binding protein|nr:ABC transporter ATP-binding protein [Deltaproteobacteria bacterium]